MKQTLAAIDTAEERMAGRLSQLSLGSSIVCAVLLSVGLLERFIVFVLALVPPVWFLTAAQVALEASALIGVGGTALNYYGYSRIIRRKERFKLRDEAVNQGLDVPSKLDNSTVMQSLVDDRQQLRSGCGCGSLMTLGLALMAALLFFFTPTQAASNTAAIDSVHATATASSRGASTTSATATAAAATAAAAQPTLPAGTDATATPVRVAPTATPVRSLPTATAIAPTATILPTTIPPTVTTAPTATPLPNDFNATPTTLTWFCGQSRTPLTVLLDNTKNTYAVSVKVTFDMLSNNQTWATTPTNPVSVAAGARQNITLTVNTATCNILGRSKYNTVLLATAAGAQEQQVTIMATVQGNLG